MSINKSEIQVDMLNGPLAKKIFMFAMPLAASGILQQLFNAADTAIVGRFAGTAALAAVGANTSIVNLMVNAFLGLALGVNVTIANSIGRGDEKKVTDAVHTAVTFSLILGAAMFFIGMASSKPLLVLTGTPETVLDQAILYLRIYVIGIPFTIVFNFCAAIVRSIGDTKSPTYCLIFTGILNLVLNCVFVIVFGMGVAGVAIATSIANIINALIMLYLLTRNEGMLKLSFKKLRIDKESIILMLKIGIPSAIQSMVFSISNVCIQSGINSLGEAAIAGSSAALNFEFIDFYLITAFNQAAVTFIGQNYAAGKYDRVKKIYKICMAESLIVMGLIIIVFVTGQNTWLLLFTKDVAAIAFGKIRINIAVATHFLICTYEITGSVLRGMGVSLLPAVITGVGIVCFRVIWLFTAFPVYKTFECIMYAYPISWIITGTLMISAYFITRKKNYKL